MELYLERAKIIAGGAAGALFGWISGVVAGREIAKSEIEAFQKSRVDLVATSTAQIIKDLAAKSQAKGSSGSFARAFCKAAWASLA